MTLPRRWPTGRTGRPTGIATRISLLGVGIVLVTGLIAGLLATGLIRSNATDDGRRVLGRLADVSRSVADDRPGSQVQVRRALAESGIRSGTLTATGTLVTGAALVRRSVGAADLARLRSGRDVSVVRGGVLVEGRALSGGRGIVLVQAGRDATARDERAIRRILLALLVAGAVAAVLGLLVARRLARPLRRTAAAARALAAGDRDVVLPSEGPAEILEVSSAVAGIAGALRHSESRQREFLLSVSHDLRTPLTTITGYAESLAEGVVPADGTAQVGAVMLGEARRLDRLVGDLLALARLDADDFTLHPVAVDVRALALAAAQVWGDRCAGAGVHFALQELTTPQDLGQQDAGRPLTAHTDPGRVRQVLDGLFENALRVTPTGASIVLAAGHGVFADGSPAAVLEVRDAGPGLGDDDLAVAFEQGELHRRYRGVRQVGTGLGLAIVHRLVTRLGGQITAGHADEGGARFTVRLPLAADPPA